MLNNLFEQSCFLAREKRGCTMDKKHVEKVSSNLCSLRKSGTCARIIWHHALLARYRWDWRDRCTEGWHHPGTHRRQHVELCRASECASNIIKHHPTIQQLASQNHRKLKFQTATFSAVANWAFLPREEMCPKALNSCSMRLTVYRIHLFRMEFLQT